MSPSRSLRTWRPASAARSTAGNFCLSCCARSRIRSRDCSYSAEPVTTIPPWLLGLLLDLVGVVGFRPLVQLGDVRDRVAYLGHLVPPVLASRVDRIDEHVIAGHI